MIRRIHLHFLVFPTLASLLLLSACAVLPMTPTPHPDLDRRPSATATSAPGPTATASPAVAPSPPLEKGSKGGEAVVGGLGRPDTLNPLLAESETSHALVPLLFDSLLATDPNSGQLTPRLAATWTVADDSQTITFTLRPDARWHDGRPVVAGDVVFTVEAARDPALDSLYGPRLSHVAQVRAPDDRAIVVSLDSPHCPLLAALGELPILPKHRLAGSDQAIKAFGDAPVGSGPFVFVEQTAEGEVRLAGNANYWDGPPYLDAWSYHPFENAADLQNALEAGQIDVAWLPAGRLPGLTAHQVYRYPAPEFVFVAFNNDHPILGDPQVRRALSMALDREQILGRTLNGAGTLIAGSLPATHWAADPMLQPPAYDPDRARQLLAAAGWTDSDGDGWLDRNGERLRLPVRTNGGNRLREDVATLVAGYYRALGIDASVEFVGWPVLLDDFFTHDFDAVVFSWPLQAELDQSQWWLSTENEVGVGDNFVSFADKQVDRMLDEALAVPGCDAGRRAEIYRQIQRALVQERPYDFLLVPDAALVTREGVSGLQPGPFASPFWNVTEWTVSPPD